jgi:thiosulfate/3-mercaptopyruvate sulfurtransferase
VTLIAADELGRRIKAADPSLRICDVRWYLGKPGAGKAAYGAGHIPGAVFVDLDRDLAGRGDGRHPLPSPAAFATRLAALGIGSGHDVVAYDDVGGAVAARLWWMLDDLGHRSVAVLDGGLRAWTEAGGELATESVDHPPAALHLAPEWSRVIDRDNLKARLGSVVLLDARAGERYRGDVEPVDPVPGHIPTARSAPAGELLGPDGRFIAPAALREHFATLGCRESEVVASCGSGVTACHTALAMRVAGLPDPVLYPGSFSDWSRAGEPVATGSE